MHSAREWLVGQYLHQQRDTRITCLKQNAGKFCCWRENWEFHSAVGELKSNLSMVLHNISSLPPLPMVLCRTGWLELPAIASADGAAQKRKRGCSSLPPLLHVIPWACTYRVREKPAWWFAKVCIDQSDAVLGVVCSKSEGSTSAKLHLLRRALQYHHLKHSPSYTLLFLN